MAERLSWISWVAAYQDGMLLLSPQLRVWPHIKKTSSTVSHHVEELYIHIFKYPPVESAVNKHWSVQSSCGLSSGELSWERLCVSVCTQWHPFIFVPLLECVFCVLNAELVGWGCGRFSFSFLTKDLFSAVCVHLYCSKAGGSGDMNMAARQPAYCSPISFILKAEKGEHEGVWSEGKSWEGVGCVSWVHSWALHGAELTH